jgi:hypothetical protein
VSERAAGILDNVMWIAVDVIAVIAVGKGSDVCGEICV